MINIIKQEIHIDESLKKKLEFICDFCNTTPTFINGSIRKINKSNLVYVEPHKVIINNIMFLVFNYSNDVYIKNFGNKIKIDDLTENISGSYAGKLIWVAYQHDSGICLHALKEFLGKPHIHHGKLIHND